MTVDPELIAGVTGHRERDAIKRKVHVDAIRQRHTAATGGRWYAVDLRHQRGGQIRIFADPGKTGGIVANVLRSGPNAAHDGEFVGHAHGDVNYLLGELDRTTVDGPAGLRLAAAILHAKEGYRHAPMYLPDSCHVCGRAADLVEQTRREHGSFTDD
jgi:hypothetical protein